MNSSQPINDRMREAQYGRLASNILRVLREAVDRRVAEGETKVSLANKLGWNRSQLSRLLNGNVGNITIKSISDILWAARFEPEDFEAMAHEDISPNYIEVLVTGTAPAIGTLPSSVKVQGNLQTINGGSGPSIQIIQNGVAGSTPSKVWVNV